MGRNSKLVLGLLILCTGPQVLAKESDCAGTFKPLVHASSQVVLGSLRREIVEINKLMRLLSPQLPVGYYTQEPTSETTTVAELYLVLDRAFSHDQVVPETYYDDLVTPQLTKWLQKERLRIGTMRPIDAQKKSPFELLGVLLNTIETLPLDESIHLNDLRRKLLPEYLAIYRSYVTRAQQRIESDPQILADVHGLRVYLPLLLTYIAQPDRNRDHPFDGTYNRWISDVHIAQYFVGTLPELYPTIEGWMSERNATVLSVDELVEVQRKLFE